MAPDEDKDVKKTSSELIENLEKTWNRLKIARSAGRRDFQTYECVLFEALEKIRELILEQGHRLDSIEKQLKKDLA